MLYSIIPYEKIFGCKYEAPEFRNISGKLFETRAGAYGGVRLSRIISTDLSDYLNPSYAPDTPVDPEY